MTQAELKAFHARKAGDFQAWRRAACRAQLSAARTREAVRLENSYNRRVRDGAHGRSVCLA